MIRKLLIGAFAAAILGLAGLGFGARSATAEVVANFWVPVTLGPSTPGFVPARDVRCPGETSPINLSGRAHYVWYTTPDGTLKMNIQAHLTGTDADGTEYVANIQRHMEHWAPFPPADPMGPYTDTFTTNLISKGSIVNAQIILTIDMFASPPFSIARACRG